MSDHHTSPNNLQNFANMIPCREGPKTPNFINPLFLPWSSFTAFCSFGERRGKPTKTARIVILAGPLKSLEEKGETPLQTECLEMTKENNQQNPQKQGKEDQGQEDAQTIDSGGSGGSGTAQPQPQPWFSHKGFASDVWMACLQNEIAPEK